MRINLLPAVPSNLPQQFSWWQQDLRRASSPPFTSALDGPLEVDVAIIGGGFTGMWTALILKERNPALQVSILDAYRCGDGASSRSGGNTHGYWSALSVLKGLYGLDRSLEIICLAGLAQERIRKFVTAKGRDVWWVEEGYLRIATSAPQKRKIKAYLSLARELDIPVPVHHLSADQLRSLCNSPRFEEGLLFEEGATVHPARLASALRDACLAADVKVFEHSPALAIADGPTCEIRTATGTVSAKSIVLANYTGTMSLPQVLRSTALFSSFPVMSQARPDLLEGMNYAKARGIADLRMFAHYFRRTRDGRILMGSGSGPVAFGNRHLAEHLRVDELSSRRARVGLQRFFPGMPEQVDAQWGFPIEVASDRIPYFGTVAGTRIHYGSGYSGHGINASAIAGECLASLVLEQSDKWSTSPFCKRDRLTFPPEPLRYLGGRPIQNSIVACEDAEDAHVPPPPLAKLISRMPSYFGIKIGTR